MWKHFTTRIEGEGDRPWGYKLNEIVRLRLMCKWVMGGV